MHVPLRPSDKSPCPERQPTHRPSLATSLGRCCRLQVNAPITCALAARSNSISFMAASSMLPTESPWYCREQSTSHSPAGPQRAWHYRHITSPARPSSSRTSRGGMVYCSRRCVSAMALSTRCLGRGPGGSGTDRPCQKRACIHGQSFGCQANQPYTCKGWGNGWRDGGMGDEWRGEGQGQRPSTWAWR